MFACTEHVAVANITSCFFHVIRRFTYKIPPRYTCTSSNSLVSKFAWLRCSWQGNGAGPCWCVTPTCVFTLAWGEFVFFTGQCLPYRCDELYLFEGSTPAAAFGKMLVEGWKVHLAVRLWDKVVHADASGTVPPIWRSWKSRNGRIREDRDWISVFVFFKVNIQACSSGMLLFIKQNYSALSIPFILIGCVHSGAFTAPSLFPVRLLVSWSLWIPSAPSLTIITYSHDK